MTGVPLPSENPTTGSALTIMTRLATLTRSWKLAVFLVMLACAERSPAAAAPGANDDALWSAHVEPLLKQHCTECHNPAKAKSALDLTSLQAMLRGGDRGASVIPGRPEESNLYKFLSADADPHMPPGNRKMLSADEAGLIKTWIEKLPGAAAGDRPAESTPEVQPGPATPAKPRIAWEPPPGMAPWPAIDRFLERAWKLDHIEPARRAGDAAFVRRLYLDLAGHIPTREETDQFLRDPSRDKRARLIDRLLAGEDHPRHLREVFDPVLMERRGPQWEDRRENQKWFAWLEDAFRRNRPWNEVVRDLIVARPAQPEDRGATWFLYERENNAQAVAEAVAPVVFGVQVKCAQCHDHMVAREIKQAHYWGMVAAFNRSKNVETPAGPGVAESAIGGFVSFANLKKESQQAKLMFFNGRCVDEAWPKEGVKETDSPELYLVPPPLKPDDTSGKDKPRRRERATKADQPAVPKFSRREAFADAVTRDNPLLSRALVNRVWAMLFGRGLVHPVDLMDSKHPPSHPELLDWLARDFAHSGYDVRRLIRALANTKAYQLESRPRSPNTKPPPPESFARALDKPLSAEQLFRSLLLATGHAPDPDGQVAGFSDKELRRAFVAQFPDLFPAEYNASLQQAMFLSNARYLDALVTPRAGNLPARLAALNSEEQRVREAFAVVFGREPDRDEQRACVNHLAARPAEAGVKQLVWALLTSAEFQVNH
jgi:hypothetical protein